MNVVQFPRPVRVAGSAARAPATVIPFRPRPAPVPLPPGHEVIRALTLELRAARVAARHTNGVA
jgi:hypothetical protein